MAAGQSKKVHCVVDVMQWTSISQRLWLLASLRKYIVLLMLCRVPVSHRGIRRRGPKNFVHVYLDKCFQRMPTYCLYVKHKLDVRSMLVMHTLNNVA